MTKVVVSAAALVLAERGALRLDRPVADFIPAFGQLSLLRCDGARVPAAAAPTIQDLLRHTAGIAYGYLGDGPTRRAYEADGLLTEDLDFWADPAEGFFVLLMMQTSSAAQRQHYRALTRAMVYAALEGA